MKWKIKKKTNHQPDKIPRLQTKMAAIGIPWRCPSTRKAFSQVCFCEEVKPSCACVQVREYKHPSRNGDFMAGKGHLWHIGMAGSNMIHMDIWFIYNIHLDKSAIYYNILQLVGGFSPPLWKIWVRQLGWWHSQLNGKKCSKPPTRWDLMLIYMDVPSGNLT